ncbi:MAG TPA: DNA primase, partial [Eubacteriaceae bacterium]|nr:DNA primase [Eubacteriaceae bacterium]
NSRGISSNTIVKFGLGYALEDWEGLYQFLLNKNYSKEDISKSGLVIPKKTQDSEYYDRFRNRLIFPVFNLTNKIIAFGGRVLDKTLPKYINSPETIIFSKGNNLYGLNKAKNNIKDGQIIIAEGYMDVISLYEHGLDNVVASLGTALTKEQGKILSRYAEEIILAYDGDDAGRQATLRAIEVLIPFECKIKVLILPKGMDPDDYINKFGLTGFLLQIKKALPMVEYKIKLAREKYDLNSTEGKIDFSKEIAEILKNIKSEIEIDAYIQKISKETGIYESAIKSEVYSHKKRQIKYKTSAQKNRIGNNRNTIEYKINSNRKKSALILAEENLLYAISQDMQVFNKVKKLIDWKDFSLDIHRAIGEIIYNKMNKKEMVIPAQLLNIFNSVQEGRVVSEIFSKNYSKELINKNILEYINTIEIHKLQNKIDKLNKDIKIMNEKGNVDIEKSNETYIELVELKRKLERLKGK